MTVAMTSIQAYHAPDVKRSRVRQEDRVLAVLEANGRPLTIREIAAQIGIPDSTVSGRLNDLKNSGRVDNYLKRKCTVTGRQKLTWFLAPPTSQRSLFLAVEVMPADTRSQKGSAGQCGNGGGAPDFGGDV